MIYYDTIRHTMIQYDTMWYNTLQDAVLQYETVWSNIIKNATISYNVLHYNMLWWNLLCPWGNLFASQQRKDDVKEERMQRRGEMWGPAPSIAAFLPPLNPSLSLSVPLSLISASVPHCILRCPGPLFGILRRAWRCQSPYPLLASLWKRAKKPLCLSQDAYPAKWVWNSWRTGRGSGGDVGGGGRVERRWWWWWWWGSIRHTTDGWWEERGEGGEKKQSDGADFCWEDN